MKALEFAVKILSVIIYIPVFLVILPWWFVAVCIQVVLKITASYEVRFMTPHDFLEAVLEELF